MSMAGFDPNEEVTLHSSRKEKEDIEEMADLYGIIKATDMLEAAYTRGHIGAGVQMFALVILSSFTMFCRRRVHQCVRITYQQL